MGPMSWVGVKGDLLLVANMPLGLLGHRFVWLQRPVSPLAVEWKRSHSSLMLQDGQVAVVLEEPRVWVSSWRSCSIVVCNLIGVAVKCERRSGGRIETDGQHGA